MKESPAVKVLDLACAQGHAFEGWFASEDDFQGQQGRGLVSCPVCSDASVRRMPSAPRLSLGQACSGEPAASAGGQARPEAQAGGAVASLPAREMQAAWLQMVRRVLAQTEDVGARFAEEARRIHYGEAKERGIRGQATPQQTEDLLEEGIAVMPLPIPDGLKGPVQ